MLSSHKSVKWLTVGVALADECTGIVCGNIDVAQGGENPSDKYRAVARSSLGRVAQRRKSGRLRQATTLACNLGAIVDLSASGARILRTRKLRGKLDVILFDSVRLLKLRAEVIWCKRLGFRKYEVGLKFHQLTPDDAGELTELASSNR